MAVDVRLTIRLVFLAHALATGSMFTRIPDIQTGLGIDAGILGLCLLGQPVGAIAIFLFAGRLIEALGTRTILLLALPLAAILVTLMAVAPTPLVLFLVFAVFGMTFAVSNVAMNVEAGAWDSSPPWRPVRPFAVHKSRRSGTSWPSCR
jgi:MFS family permease